MKDIFKYSKNTEELPFDLKITHDSPLQLTFLKTDSGNHILGYVTIWDGELIDPEIIFANVGEGTLIPSVSSFDFDKDMSGAGLDFFLINDGFNLNQDMPCFKDIVAGKGGRLAFIERCGEWQNRLRKADGSGELEWVDKESDDFVQEAVAASINSVNPLLVWIPDDDGEDVQILAGHIFHTFAKEGGALALNPDGFCHAKIYFDAMPDSLSFGFCEMLDPDSGLYNDVKFRLALGEENVAELLPETINAEGALDEVEEREISSIIIKITDGFCDGDVLRPWMIHVEEDGVVDGAGVSFTNLDKEGCLLLDGKAEKSVYESLLKHIRLCNLEGKDLKKVRGLSFKIMTDGGEYNTTGTAIAEKASGEFGAEDKDLEAGEDTLKREEIKEEEKEEKEETEPKESKETPLENHKETSLEKPFEKPLFRISPLAASERKTVLITGAAKRVGKVLALAFAYDGWNVIIHCNTSLEDARALAKEIAKCKVRTAILQADLGDESEVVQIFPQIFNVFDKVDLLVNCASVFDDDDLFTSSEESWNRHMMINLRAPVLLMRDFAQQFIGKENGVGDIVNIIDAGILRAKKSFFSYSVSKAALESATKLAAAELAPNVKVNAVSPWQVMPSKYTTAKDFDALVGASPLGIKNSADEIYEAIKFILKTDSMTGQMITLDSGTFL